MLDVAEITTTAPARLCLAVHAHYRRTDFFDGKWGRSRTLPPTGIRGVAGRRAKLRAASTRKCFRLEAAYRAWRMRLPAL